jgi:hypothetical protein
MRYQHHAMTERMFLLLRRCSWSGWFLLHLLCWYGSTIHAELIPLEPSPPTTFSPTPPPQPVVTNPPVAPTTLPPAYNNPNINRQYDRFNYRSTTVGDTNYDFGPEDWEYVQCPDLATCVRIFVDTVFLCVLCCVCVYSIIV